MADHAQPDPEVIEEFSTWLESAKVKGAITESSSAGRHFVPFPKVAEYFNNRPKIQRLLVELGPDKDLVAHQRTIEVDYRRVFCILLVIGKGPFIANFVRHGNLSDRKLPFDTESASFHLATGSARFFREFYEAQWVFCAEPFRYMMDQQYEDDRILPILVKDRLSSGASAETFKIVLHRAYDELGPPEKANKGSEHRHAHTFVLKTYGTTDAEAYYRNEIQAFRKLIYAGRSVPGLIDFHGSFVHGGTRNVILEYADKGTLEEYFNIVPAPKTADDIMAFWRGMFDPILALLRIHDVGLSDPDGPPIFQGWHQDVKPSNILVVSGNCNSPYRYQFKLADLGLSHFKKHVPSTNDPADQDTYGTRTYGSPECYREGRIGPLPLNVRQTVDIWSLGCVYSEAVVWSVLEKDGLEQYRQLRKEETDPIPGFQDSGCFHNGVEVLKSVPRKHEEVLKSQRECDYFTRRVLQVMVTEMLGHENERPTAKQLWQKSRRILNDGERESKQGSSWLWWGSSRANSQPQTPLQSPPHSPPRSPTQSSATEFPHPNPTQWPHKLSSMPPLVEEPADLNVPHTPVPEIPEHLTHLGGADTTPDVPAIPDRNLSIRTTGTSTIRPQPHRDLSSLTVQAALYWKSQQRSRGFGRNKIPPQGRGDLMIQLKERDHVFLIDDSDSMREFWEDVKILFDLLAYIVKEADPDGMDLYFTSSENKITSKKTTDLTPAVEDRMSRHGGNTDMKNVLAKILQRYLDSVREPGSRTPWSRFMSKRKKPMTCYIFTDGAWPQNCEMEDPICSFVGELDQLKMPLREVGIQFINFGNDPRNIARLEHLDSGLHLRRDIVDTEPSNGNVWKMLLGSINDAFDDDPNDTNGGNGSLRYSYSFRDSFMHRSQDTVNM